MTKKIMITAVLVLLSTVLACGSGDPEDSGQGIYVDADGVAVNGADVVAYFTRDEASDALAGSTDYEYEWKGAVWRFATQVNLSAFMAEPDRYVPRYGGYCAYAMAQDDLVGTDPNAWTVRDGELFLNASLKGRTRWRKDIPGFVAKADANWPEWYQTLLDGAVSE
jgi:hypothetical protein